MVRKVPNALELRAYFYQLMSSDLGLVYDFSEHINDNYPAYKNNLENNTNYPRYRNNLFEIITDRDILKILLWGIHGQSYLPELIYYFKTDGNLPFNNYKNAPILFTEVFQIYPDAGLLSMGRFCSQILVLYNDRGKSLTDECNDMEYGGNGRFLLRTTRSVFWEEYRYEDDQFNFIDNYNPDYDPVGFNRIWLDNEEVMNELFPTYSYPGANGDWLSNLSEEEVISLLGDFNFSYRFLKTLPPAYSANIQVDPYHLLVSYYQNSPHLAIIAVKSNCLAFTLLSERLRNSREFIIQLLTDSNTTKGIYPFLSNEFKGDTEIVKLCLSWGVGILEPLAPLSDRDLLLCAIKEDAEAFKYAADGLKSSRGFILEAIQTNSLVIKHLPAEFYNDREVVSAAIKSDGDLLRYASSELQNDREIVLVAAVNSRSALRYASQALREDLEFLALIESSIENNRLTRTGNEEEDDGLPF